MGQTMKINFADLGMPVFTGRIRGQEARRRLKLDSIKDDDTVEVVIPPETYAVTSSYFLGLFGPSVRSLGLERFQQVFQFTVPDFLKEQLADWTARAFRDTNDLLSPSKGH
jgi:hypothetical protein